MIFPFCLPLSVQPMHAQFDHERLNVYQQALRFVAWVGPLIDELPAKLAARDQLDRASMSIALNLAEGNGERSHPDQKAAINGKSILLEVVAMTAGLLARFSAVTHEDSFAYGAHAETSGCGTKKE